ncbi:Predicted phosphoesterase [Ruminococcus sp. YE71]|uniref:metallophosphoesterase family protein n=1 Tax=unclassified Ruminococcus TaxID=2608920 RepID=UPI00088040BB|nr:MULTISPECIES: metallophosphoesterase [unclassified Ruminococcus]SDA11773.1 Predicted phosphoesterase [Ruminococcus sp. YE78]SFW15719.1 Predicted phosphoesterase [Ruminococcus sp. YE71]
MIVITGDIHGTIDIAKLDIENTPGLAALTENDYLIIAGDFGLIWSGSEEEQYWLDWLDSMPWTTLFIDGNHENFDMLEKLPEEEWHGGRIHRVTDKIFHLMRGQIFEIEGLTFFTFGGAESHDKYYRVEGESWWPQELPSKAELLEGRHALENAGFKVDYILTHCAPTSVQRELILLRDDDSYTRNVLTEFLEGVKIRTQYERWFCGHYHIDFNSTVDPKLEVLYYDFVQIGGDGVEEVIETETAPVCEGDPMEIKAELWEEQPDEPEE